MLKKRSFWVGFIIGGIVFFLYVWFSIWATYIALERQNKERDIELQQIKRIIFAIDTIEQEHAAIIEWNEQHMQPKPKAVVFVEDQ